MTETERDRAEFEAWAETNIPDVDFAMSNNAKHDEAVYKNYYLQCVWEGWKGRAAKASEAGSAQQAEAEPVAWMFQHEETGVITIVDTQQVEWGFEKNNPRHQRIGPLYTAQPAAPVVPEGWMLFPVEAWEFLRGAGPLDGVHFGEKHPERKGNFWWRSYIREMLASPQPAEQERTCKECGGRIWHDDMDGVTSCETCGKIVEGE